MLQLIGLTIGLVLMIFAGVWHLRSVWHQRDQGFQDYTEDKLIKDLTTRHIDERIDEWIIRAIVHRAARLNVRSLSSPPIANFIAIVGAVLVLASLIDNSRGLLPSVVFSPPPALPNAQTGHGPGESLVLPSRMFTGPSQYPPAQFKAYGIVAFPTRPTSGDIERYQVICDGYVAGLLHITDMKAPLQDQMVTVWPIDSDRLADEINRTSRDLVCDDAVPNYGLAIALDAIAAARRQKAVLSGQGPFLLAWAPGLARDRTDALVLVVDMSDVINVAQAKQIFAQWALDIQENPELWNKGWNEGKLKIVIRLWVDKWGEKILKAVGLKA